MTAYLLKKKLSGQARFPLVLMLEPLHACNLKCAGCGRIREYSGTLERSLSVAECLEAVDECGAPVVSICGGEPLIYPGLKALTDEILARKKHIYLCTNGLLLEEKLKLFKPSTRFFINVHVDGMEATHDAITGRQGVFNRALAGIRAAKAAGFLVYTNTTIYKQTDPHEIAVLFDYLTELGVDGFMISPAYGYDSVRTSASAADETIFMTRQEVHAKFCRARTLLGRFKLVTSPVYLDFLCGLRELPCAAWANPTRNALGWKGPCYLITDGHYDSYAELAESTAWDSLGPTADPRCEHCLVHCGFEPAAVLAANKNIRDVLKMALWQVT
jgi:hopanoid biosynthesis associated radical SAM protein HpnH